MAAHHSHLDYEDDFGGDFLASHNIRRPGDKRNFDELEDDEDVIFGSKKGSTKVEETAMILSLRDSLETCKSSLAICQAELETTKSEIHNWHTSFANEPFVPGDTSLEPNLVIDYLQSLRSSEESLREQLEKSKKKEAAFVVTFGKREQEITELKCVVRNLKAQLKPPSMQARRLLLDPAIHEEFSRLKNLVEEKDKKIKELQDNISAVSFTPQSKMGQMLMAKCRTLQEENEEIGNQAAEGKLHELSMKLALQKSQTAELRNQFEGLYRHMAGLTNDVERSHEMVLILQKETEVKNNEIAKINLELQQNISVENGEGEVVKIQEQDDAETKPREQIDG